MDRSSPSADVDIRTRLSRAASLRRTADSLPTLARVAMQRRAAEIELTAQVLANDLDIAPRHRPPLRLAS